MWSFIWQVCIEYMPLCDFGDCFDLLGEYICVVANFGFASAFAGEKMQIPPALVWPAVFCCAVASFLSILQFYISPMHKVLYIRQLITPWMDSFRLVSQNKWQTVCLKEGGTREMTIRNKNLMDHHIPLMLSGEKLRSNVLFVMFYHRAYWKVC